MRIFITGASGFVGQNFLRLLLDKKTPGQEVFCLCRKTPDVSLPGVHYMQGSLETIAEHADVLLTMDYVFHIAASASITQAVDFHATNVVPTKKIIEILEKSTQLKRFVFLSSIGAVDRKAIDRCENPLRSEVSEPNPRSQYGKSKLDSEQVVRASGLPWTILRPGWIYGPGMRANSHLNHFVGLAALGRSFLFRLAFPGRVSLIHVDDLTNALWKVIGSDWFARKSYFAVVEDLSIAQILENIWRQMRGTELWRISLSPLVFMVKRCHGFLPLPFGMLFLPYLVADSRSFIEDFQILEPKLFTHSLDDLILSNARANGAVIITGANSGIGYALAKSYAERNLVLVDQSVDNLSDFKNALVLKMDLRNEDEIFKLTSKVQGPICCLINNAGIGSKGNFSDLDVPRIDAMIDVNVRAPALLTKVLLDRLVRDESTIVNIESSVAYDPLPGMSLYAATKAFGVSWSTALAWELRKTNAVITVSPSGTNTQFQKSAGVTGDSSQLLSPDFVAQKIKQEIEKSQSKHFVIGLKSKVFLMALRFLPIQMRAKVWGFLFQKMR